MYVKHSILPDSFTHPTRPAFGRSAMYCAKRPSL